MVTNILIFGTLLGETAIFKLNFKNFYLLFDKFLFERFKSQLSLLLLYSISALFIFLWFYEAFAFYDLVIFQIKILSFSCLIISF